MVGGVRTQEWALAPDDTAPRRQFSKILRNETLKPAFCVFAVVSWSTSHGPKRVC